MRTREILIVGGGIAGLTLARGLVLDGHRVALIERAPAWAPTGAGITLAGNAMAILDRLALGDAVRAAGQRIPGGAVLDEGGRPLVETRLDDAEESPALSNLWAIHRADLHEVLLAGAKGAELRLGTTVDALTETREGRVLARLSDETERTFDLVVGADGIRSSVRAAALGAKAPEVRYAGYTCWRVVAPNRTGLDSSYEMWGRGARVGLVPLPGERIYGFFVANAPRAEEDPAGEDRAELLRVRFGGFGGPARELLDSLGDEGILRHDIEELAGPVWGHGRMLLIGDAAHAMTPNMGQGAAQGVEDALALCLALQRTDDDLLATSEFRAARNERVASVQRASRRIGAIGQWSNPLACALRNAVLRAIPSKSTVRNLERTIAPGMQLAAEP